MESTSRPKFIDIGANLTDSMYNGIYHGSNKHLPDLGRVLERAKGIGMEKIIITSGCLQDVYESLEICEKYDKECKFLFTTVGVHPTRCNEFVKNKYSKSEKEYLDALDELIARNRSRIVAIGELGLDYDRLQFCDKDVQKKYFEFQLTLAEKHKLPLFLHMRNASADTFEILQRNKSRWSEAGGVCHSFTGDLESLKGLLDDGLFIGINGCSLKTDSNLEVVKNIPLDKLMLETDCPWCGIKNTHASSKYVKTVFNSIRKPEKMTEETILSSRNEPCHILNVAEVVYQLLSPNVDFKEFCDRVYENTVTLFKGVA
ncbi:hydrolase, TatD family member protein [Theileria equi strain WA]|uniref:Hydrolase, TatD family member protein n=1 Tax=Theileria equi strain WA TaxID=1537102 RepID=L0AVM0_THEEQ|nr:hydrolase, TatD family member protein [Theileria equi strain WA]AFZ79657.1 hydrolase, TatD family member protein [Theileria equi strain WA]|eukprot:XP_004829323.1 hydrolase, TatD family member protein [Theileria equi strain WA]